MSKFTNMICELSHGAIGYILDSIIVSTISNTIITEWELNLPWEDPLFQWLADGDDSGQQYSFPGKHPLEFPRDEVLNHRFRSKRPLRRGDMLEGLLLGVGYAPIPEVFPHGCEISMDFTIHSQWGFSHPSQFCMWVCRDVDAARRNSAKDLRKPLFSDYHDQEPCNERLTWDDSGRKNRDPGLTQNHERLTETTGFTEKGSG